MTGDIMKSRVALKNHRLGTLLATLAVTLLGFTSVAFADNGTLEKAVVVFELYLEDSETLEKTPAYTKALVNALNESPNVAVLGRSDGEKLLAGQSMKATRATEGQYAEREQALKEATNAVLNGDKSAVSLLKKSMRALTQLAAKVVVDEKLHGIFLKNHMLLAQAYLDQGEESRLKDILEKVMRHFGPQAFNEEETHPGIVKVWKVIGQELKAEATGEVSITSNPPGADIYIQGKRLAQKTPATLKNLLPGEVLIQLRKGEAASIAHMVKVKKSAKASLAIDLKFEKSLRISGDRFGLSFANQAEFEANGAQFASRLGKLLDVDTVLLVGLRAKGNKVAFAGASVDVATQTLTKQVQVEARANVVVRSRVRDLAWLLIRDFVMTSGNTAWYKKTWGWVSAGVGLTGIIVGSVLRADYDERLAALTGPCEKLPCEVGGEVVKKQADLQNAADSAELVEGTSNVSLIVGGLAIVGSVLLFILDGGDDEASSKEKALPSLQSIGPQLLQDGSLGMGASWSF
jgi:hypothetical protein